MAKLTSSMSRIRFLRSLYLRLYLTSVSCELSWSGNRKSQPSLFLFLLAFSPQTFLSITINVSQRHVEPSSLFHIPSTAGASVATAGVIVVAMVDVGVLPF